MGNRLKATHFIWFAVLIFGVTVLLPLVSLILISLSGGGNLFTGPLNDLFQPDVLRSIANSLFISAVTGTVSVAAGCGFAFFLAKTDLPLKNLLFLLLLLPLLLPPYITTVAWADVWLYTGLPRHFIYSRSDVIFILSIIYTPLAAFIISGSLKNISGSIEEAGLMVAPYRIVFFRVILPLIRPALFSSFILIFILVISEFAVPSYLGVSVFTTEIFTQFTAFYNYSSAIAHGLVLTFVCLMLILPERYYLSQAPFVSFGKRSFNRLVIGLENKGIWLMIFVVYLLFFVFLPVLMLVVQAFTGHGASLSEIIITLLPSLNDSLLLSLAGALIITLFGYAFAMISIRYKFKFIDSLLLIIFAVPAIVTGIALTKFFNTPALNFIYSSWSIILIAYMARFLFISQKVIAGGLMQIPASYGEAAALMGASPFYIFKKITLPLMSDAFFTSFFIILIFSVAELTTVIMVYPPGISLLPVRIFTLMANAPQSTVSGMCLVALLFTLIFIIIMMAGRKLLINQQWMRSRS